ncbi:cation:proton antiporter [Halobacteriales archaeon QS_4_66_20]|nr:MAG: cation:proton antiporter [Halobacteriales archaeon QH_7_66_37]PSP91281.1 MAG: cation:proton antiporter [Halobacteriales archaeon QS_4_66_20]
MTETLLFVGDLLTSQYTYLLFAILLVVGLYIVVASSNLVKKVIGLNLFQTAIFLFFISAAYVRGGQSPILPSEGAGEGLYASPLPQVLVLTAIVVGVALTAVGLALIVRIYSEYGTLDEETLREVRADE